MAESRWSRPDTVPYPLVWHEFTAPDPDTRQPTEYVVQDLPPDRVQDAIEHMCEHFVRDEPICRSLRLVDDPVAILAFGTIWRRVAADRCAVICFRKGHPDEIVGVNMLTVVRKGSPNLSGQFSSIGFRLFYDCTVYMTECANLYERYGVKQFLTAWGLSVAPKYRGLGISTEILRVRAPMCKAFNLKLSATVFSHPGSQAPAAKVGFQDEFVQRFSVLADKGFVFPDIDVEWVKLMVLNV